MNKILVLFVMMLAGIAASAQTDFSGSWKLNTSKSNLNSDFSMAPREIIIKQSGNDLNVEKHSSFQNQDFTISDKYTLDGKECINKGWRDTEKKSTAVWGDDKKSLKITSRLPMQGGEEMTINETYQLNGSTLTLDSQASSSYGDVTEKMVYDKQ